MSYCKYTVEITAEVVPAGTRWYWEVSAPRKCLTNGYELTEDAANEAMQAYLKRLQAVTTGKETPMADITLTDEEWELVIELWRRSNDPGTINAYEDPTCFFCCGGQSYEDGSLVHTQSCPWAAIQAHPTLKEKLGARKVEP